MADIRFKDLTTTASSTASDDFIAVDGTTNGTRKLSAFSPTFGGNATVTGTLTVNGASTLTGATTIGGDSSNGNYLSYNSDISGFCGLWMRQSSKSATNYVLASNGTSGTLVNATGASLFLRIENTTALEINTSRNVLIPTTTASTTTSTGALVVGNGTSGGLGVGGAITAGGGITSTNPGGVFQITGTGNTGASKELIFYRSDGGDTLNFGLTGSAYAGILTGLGNNEAYFYYSSSSAFRIFLGTAATQRYDFTANQFKINATTAANSTSSGALVVSGGVGVGGAINAGGDIATAATMRSVGFHVPGNGAGRPASTDSYLASTATTQIPLYVSGYTGGGQTADILRVSLNSSSDWFAVKGNGQVACYATTASTSTSSGALVVSGGVGVAGAIYAGGNITIDKAAPDFTLTRSVNTNSGLIQLTTSTTYDFAIGLRNTTDSDLHIYNYGTSNDALKIARATSAVTLNSTTASTSTSSGALVVSGGVGVAGAMNVGGVITTAAEYLQGSNVNFNIISTATNGNVYLKSNGGTLYLNNTAGNGDIRLGNTGTVAYVVGTAASTTTLTGAILVSGGVGVSGAVNAGTFYGLVDGVTAPATESGYARIYVDSADGDLKVKFGDGTVKTIATDS